MQAYYDFMNRLDTWFEQASNYDVFIRAVLLVLMGSIVAIALDLWIGSKKKKRSVKK